MAQSPSFFKEETLFGRRDPKAGLVHTYVCRAGKLGKNVRRNIKFFEEATRCLAVHSGLF